MLEFQPSKPPISRPGLRFLLETAFPSPGDRRASREIAIAGSEPQNFTERTKATAGLCQTWVWEQGPHDFANREGRGW